LSPPRPSAALPSGINLPIVSTLLLIFVIFMLNVLAVQLRSRLRRKFVSAVF
jgi:ABC-type uncharacterized transport system permease subunit